ncbi:hypothetical protein QNH10_06585 [Sporosarcina thermotolerans]|uniref:hypothetical protein n=1 Tax=Sporosarcina thermotolerans TaxID=633404 RepID=UPI0024BCB1CD|nr:hypothetical protein [Sporosarcina thermotolerans]WHT49272.1 hypothetical protein QNH10_06585 [Sporosarcina thermotolerans]
MNPLESFTFTAVAGSVVLVTGSPDWPFVQSVMGFVKNRKSVICFVVVNKTVPVSERLQEQIRYAESKGITIHVLGKMQFSDAFKEVANL